MLHNQNNERETPPPLDAAAMVRRLAAWTVQWHSETAPCAEGGDLLEWLHRTNFVLWHLEDAARDPAVTDQAIADTKRAIDRANQQRNDAVERFDGRLLQQLAVDNLPAPHAPLHSETPGMMTDRLSILTLKLFHTAEEVTRADTDQKHRTRNRERLAILQQQCDDLARCLDDLLTAVRQGTRSYRLYRQLKMYNDPELNPVLYNASLQRR